MNVTMNCVIFPFCHVLLTYDSTSIKNYLEMYLFRAQFFIVRIFHARFAYTSDTSYLITGL